jgi:hypothetical protein
MDLEDLSLLSDEEFYSMSEAFTSNHFWVFRFSPFFDFDLLWSVRRLYRMDHWIFWSPVDLLDKRYYVPLISDLSVFKFSFKDDFFIKNNSIFYKKAFMSKEEASFNKENLFFYDFPKYDFFKLDFLNYQIFPNKGSFDVYNQKVLKDSVSFKPKIMSFKIFLSIIWLYLKNFICVNICIWLIIFNMYLVIFLFQKKNFMRNLIF